MRIIAEIDGWHKELEITGEGLATARMRGTLVIGLVPPMESLIAKKDLKENEAGKPSVCHFVELHFDRFDEWGKPVFKYR